MSAPADAGRRAAVVDVGSNSVRLVLYRIEGRAIWSVYNERVLAGLGQGVGATGRLSPEGVTQARAALRRFRALLDAAPDTEVFTAATAAVREATDGPDFAAAVLRESGFALNVISGEEEARLGALGVLAGAPDAEGLVGDLGGSSLELTPVSGGAPRPGVSLKLGPFALGAPAPFGAAELRRRIDAQLKAAPRAPAPCLHAVGGAWRNMALIHAKTTGYPLHVVHGYELRTAEILDLCRFVAQQSRASLERMEGVGKKRAETLPYAAVVLERVVERLKLERVVFSGYGVREGLLLEALPPAVRALDPLVEGCASLGSRRGAEDFGPALERWGERLFSDLPHVLEPRREARLFSAACRLADVGARMHPDHRGELAAAAVLRAPIPGQSHADRAFLAAALYARYQSGDGLPEPEVTRRLLSDEERRRARAAGALLRLGMELCGRNAALLERTPIRLDRGRVVLSASRADADLLSGDGPRKRLNTLADLLAREVEVEIA